MSTPNVKKRARPPVLSHSSFRLHPLQLLLALQLSSILPAAYSQPSEELLRQRMDFWLREAPVCAGNPTKLYESSDANARACNDGDMNLFSALLCIAGVRLQNQSLIGCESVASAQDADGRWYRSPRRKLDPSIDAAEHAANIASFSPDMALGTELYLVTTSDSNRASLWLQWLDAHRPCWAGSEPDCSLPQFGLNNIRGLPRFCTDEPGPPQPGETDSDRLLRQLRIDPRCSMRPGDLSTLGQMRNRLKVYHTDPMVDVDDCKVAPVASYDDAKKRLDNLERLLNLTRLENVLAIAHGGLVYTLRLTCADAISWTRVAAEFNQPGYSQHLVAVSVLLLRRIGISDQMLNDAASRLAAKQPENPFFLYLAEGSTENVLGRILEHCPKTSDDAKNSLKSEWIWERDFDATKWHTKASLWDCLFISNLWLQGRN
jgi:hypothetical protein